MSGFARTASGTDAMPRWWSGSTATKGLLMSALAAVVVYAVGDVLSSLLYDGYSAQDQAISELSAFGSPVRSLMLTAILVHGLFLLALGLGVLRAARRRIVWWIGALLIAIGVLGLPTHTVWAMSSRGMETGFNDTMHIALSAVFSLLVVAAIVLSALAYRGWFRLYSIITIVVIAGFGMASGVAIGGIEENDTPWAGGFERINAYTYFVWLIVLAVTVIRRELPASPSPAERGDTGATRSLASGSKSRVAS